MCEIRRQTNTPAHAWFEKLKDRIRLQLHADIQIKDGKRHRCDVQVVMGACASETCVSAHLGAPLGDDQEQGIKLETGVERTDKKE